MVLTVEYCILDESGEVVNMGEADLSRLPFISTEVRLAGFRAVPAGQVPPEVLARYRPGAWGEDS